MNNYLIMSDEFYPYENASTNCLSKVIEEMVKNGVNVTVLCTTYNHDDLLSEKKSGYRIERIYMNERQNRLYGNFPFNGEWFGKRLLNIYFMLYYRTIKTIKLIRKYNKMIKKESYDYLISVNCPYRNHEFAFLFNQKRSDWIVLNFDPYVYNYSASKIYWWRKTRERIWGLKAKKIIYAIGIAEDQRRNNYYPFKKAQHITLPLPNLVFNNINNIPKEKKSNKTLLRYTGAFYESIRNPDCLIKMLYHLNAENYKVEFYGDSCNYLKKHHVNLPKCVNLRGTVSTKECQELMESADVLINVSNSCPNQVPSKVFEYISTGKPIINIYFIENDPSLIYLNKYPSILNIDAKKPLNYEEIDTFLASFKDTPKALLADIYEEYLCENIVKKMREFIEKNGENYE